MRGLCVLLLTVLPLAAAPGPSEAALAYLRGLAEQDAKPDLSRTAISQEITRDRKEEIQEEVAHLKESLHGADLNLLEEKEDGDVAAVLIVQGNGGDITDPEIHAVGMVKRGENWLPAPVPSSFQNTGMNFQPELLPHARALEEWMIRTRSERLVDVRETARKAWSEGLERAVPKELLRSGKPDAMVEALVAAFAKGDRLAVFALLGGSDDTTVPDWGGVSAAVRQALAAPAKVSQAWGLLTRPQVLRAVVDSEQGPRQSTVDLVCQDPGPERPQRPRVLHFTVVKGEAGLWRVELPELLVAAASNEALSAQIARESMAADAGKIALFPAKLQKKYPVAPLPEAKATADAFVAAVRETELERAVPLMDFTGDTSEEAQTKLSRVASLWAGLHSPMERRTLIPLGFFGHDAEACAIYQLFSTAASGEAQLIRVYLSRQDKGGWLATLLTRSDPMPGGDVLKGEVAAAQEKLNANWTAGLTATIKTPLAPEGPSEEDARALLGRWLSARSAGDATGMLGMMTSVDDVQEASSVAKNLGYELAERNDAEIGPAYRDGSWTWVAAKTRGVNPSYGLYPVLPTPEGPKILLEMYLRTGGKSADYLNRKTFARMEQLFPGDTREKAAAILEKYAATLTEPSK